MGGGGGGGGGGGPSTSRPCYIHYPLLKLPFVLPPSPPSLVLANSPCTVRTVDVAASPNPNIMSTTQPARSNISYCGMAANRSMHGITKTNRLQPLVVSLQLQQRCSI